MIDPARRGSSRRDTPLGINVAAGAAVVVACALASAVVPRSAEAVRLGLFALALWLFAAVTVDPLAVALVGVVGFAVFDGFLVNQLGDVTWHGAADMTRLSVLVIAAVSGLAAGAVYRAIGKARLWRARQEQVQAWAREMSVGPKEERKKEDKRGA